jgi:3-hydroxy-9,10-secoandrosta-1,3,5(10)-triene-9,17-dione monooxygenase reductase component
MTDTPPFDEGRFRQVLGHFASGVTVITAASANGPVGLAVGSFVSVSLEPPFVGFLPKTTSSSWPQIEASGHFCVNVLAEAQEDVCRRFASTGEDKFRGLGWHTAASGAPILDGILAWIDCNIETVTEAGDHYFVLGRVRDLAVVHDGAPLLFFRGGYGRFAV